MPKIVDFRVYSAATGAPLAGASAQFAFTDLTRENASGSNDPVGPYVFVDEGLGRYSFSIPDADLLPGSTIFYVINLGANSAALYVDGSVDANAVAAEVGASSTYVNEGIDQRAEVLQSTIDSIVYWPKVDGANVTPSSGTAKVLDPYGGVKVAEAAVVVGANGQLPLSQLWDLPTYPLSEDYNALFTYVYNGVTYSDRVYFDVVKTKLLCQIDTNDLKDFYPDIEKHVIAIGEVTTAKFIRRAWSTMLDRIRGGGNRPSLILDKARLVNPAIHLALHFACGALTREPGDVWDTRQQNHAKLYDKLFGDLGQLRYDMNEDAVADRAQETSRINRRNFRV